MKYTICIHDSFAREGVELAYRQPIEEQGNCEHENVGCICERAGDFTPTEYLLMFAVGVSVTTPIIRKVSAICLALFFGEKFDVSR